MNLKGKSFLKLLDLTNEEMAGLLDLGILGMFNRAITPETADAGETPATDKTEPGDNSGN